MIAQAHRVSADHVEADEVGLPAEHGGHRRALERIACVQEQSDDIVVVVPAFNLLDNCSNPRHSPDGYSVFLKGFEVTVVVIQVQDRHILAGPHRRLPAREAEQQEHQHDVEETAQFMLRRFPRDLPTLFALLDTLDTASLIEQRRLTIPFVKSVLDNKQ